MTFTNTELKDMHSYTLTDTFLLTFSFKVVLTDPIKYISKAFNISIILIHVRLVIDKRTRFL
jgi:hypothetical protein